jgi:hypothetical protein
MGTSAEMKIPAQNCAYSKTRDGVPKVDQIKSMRPSGSSDPAKGLLGQGFTGFALTQ